MKNHNQKYMNIFDDIQKIIEYVKRMVMEDSDIDNIKDIGKTIKKKKDRWFLKYILTVSKELAKWIYNWLFVWIFYIIKGNIEKIEKQSWIIILNYTMAIVMSSLILLIPIFLITVIIYLLKTGLIWIYNNVVYFVFGLLKLIVILFIYVVVVILIYVIASALISLAYVLIKKILIYLNLVKKDIIRKKDNIYFKLLKPYISIFGGAFDIVFSKEIETNLIKKAEEYLKEEKQDVKNKFKLWGMIVLLSLVVSFKLLFATIIVVLSIVELMILFYKFILVSISVSNEIFIMLISSVKIFWFLWLFILGIILSISLVYLVISLFKNSFENSIEK